MRDKRELLPSVAEGVRLTTVQQALEQVIRVVFTLVLAHLVAPDDFGLMSMAFVVTYLAILVSDLGVGTALVQRAELRPAHITTAFTISSVFGIALAALTALLARPLSEWFNEPRLAPVLLALSVTFVCKGVQGAPRDLLRRELLFVPYTVSAMVALLLGVVVGVVAGFAGAGVWALVLYSVVESVAAMALSLLFAVRAGVWRPTIGVDRQAFRDLAGFTSYMIGARGLMYVQNTADNVVVGRVLGASALGFYSVAYRTMLLPVQKVADVVSSVAVPALAVVQADRPRLRRAYLRAQEAAAVVSFPMSAGVVALTPLAVPLLLGSPWRPAISTVQILALNGPRLVLGRLAASLFQAIGRPGWDFWLLAVSVPLSVVAFLIGAQYGIVGVAIALTVVGHSVAVIQLVLVAHALQTTTMTILRRLGRVVLPTAALVVAAITTRWLVPSGIPAVVELVLAALCGGLAYVATMSHSSPGTLRAIAADVFRRPRQPSPELEAVS